MGSSAGDDRTFKVALTSDGAARLRDRVKEKLKEFMGDYTDDTLVEYIVVLLIHGKRKEEASRELNVFLGDDSTPFISWLWDHLSSKLHMYVQPKENFSDEMATAQPVSDGLTAKQMQTNKFLSDEKSNSDFENEKIRSNRRTREWKGLMQEKESFSFRSTLTGSILSREKTIEKPTAIEHSSLKSQEHRKRSRDEEYPSAKMRQTISAPRIDAPRRILQFAVRDAVRNAQQSTSISESVPKRLQSVVSTSTSDSIPEVRPTKLRSIARVPGAFATALKAAADAAEDVTRLRYSSSVKLGHGCGESGTSGLEQPLQENVEYKQLDRIPESDLEGLHDTSRNGVVTRDLDMLECVNEMASVSTSEEDDFDVGVSGHECFDASQSATSANRDKKSLTVQCSVAQDANAAVSRKTRPLEQDLPVISSAKGSSKIVNISVNVNTWKPPNYVEPKDKSEVENRASCEKNEVAAALPNTQQVKEKRAPTMEKENESGLKDANKESRKAVTSTPGSYPISRPSEEDVDSRTVFVSNVHFGATKDSLSRHFNKFGEVLKVIIITDAATGQPKGSAYVEFLRKESAELALSLNGSSFMSRILKVVKRSSAHPETTAMMGWPRIARASQFAASRLTRMPYPRGAIAGAAAAAYRPRLPLKAGVRSLQWKRDAPAAEALKGLQNAPSGQGSGIPSPSGRSLTYVRPETKADPHPGGT